MQNPRIYNGTNHHVNLYSKDSVYFDRRRRWTTKDGASPLLSLKREIPLNIRYDLVYRMEGDISMADRRVLSIDPIPEDFDIIVTSATYAEHSDNPKVRSPVTHVFNPSGKIVGCLHLGFTTR